MTFRKFQYRFLLLLIVLSVLPGLNVLYGELQFDDNVTILSDDCIKDAGLLARLFLEGGYLQRAVLRATFSLNYHLGNTNTFGYHLLNILFHVWNGILVFSLCPRFLAMLPGSIQGKNPAWGKMVFMVPAFSSLLFILLPIQTETTAYISSRSSSLAAFFYLLGITFFLGFLFNRGRGGLRWILPLLGLALCVLLGLGAKEEFFSFPIILMLIYFFRSATPPSRFIKENRVLILAFILIPSFALGLRGHAFFQDYQKRADYWKGAYQQELKNKYVGSEAEFVFKRGLYSVFGLESGYEPSMYTPYSYLLTEMTVVPTYYLRKILFPFELNLEPDVPIINKFDIRPLISLFFIAAFLGASWLGRSWHSLFPLSASWFFIALLPTSSFLPLFDVASEHRTYIATPGLSIFLGMAFSRLLAGERENRSSFLLKTGAVVLALFCFSAVIIKRNADWNTVFGVWADAARKSPSSSRVHNNLALGYVAKGRIHEAIREYQISIELRPSGDNYNNLAMAYGRLRLFDKAIQTYEESIKLEPDLATTYYKFGVLLQDLGDHQRAEESYQKAIARNGRYPEAYNNLGHIYLMRNQMEKARTAFEKALEIRPFHPESLNNLGALCRKTGDFTLAEQYFLRALAFNPRMAQTHLNIGSLYLQMGKDNEAEKHLLEAVRLDNRLEPAHAYLGDFFLQKGMLRESARAYTAALEINAVNPTLHRNLGVLYYNQLNDPKKALYHFKRTLELDPAQDHADDVKKAIDDLSGAKE